MRLSAIRVRPPVIPLRADNPAAEKDGDRDAVSLDHRCKLIIAGLLSGAKIDDAQARMCQTGLAIRIDTAIA